MDPTHPIPPPPLRELAFPKGDRFSIRFILKEIFNDQLYLRHGMVLEPGATIVDAGAHVGLFALFCHQVCGGNCSVFSFEPIPETADSLRRNIARFADGGNIKVVEAGLTSIDGPEEAEFLYLPLNPGGSTYKPDEKTRRLTERRERWFQQRGIILRKLQGPWLRLRQRNFLKNPHVRCKLTNLSQACAEFGIQQVDLLKIDVEDAELDVMRGIDDTLWPRIQQVVMEVHLPARLAEVEETLRQRGFTRIHVDPMKWADDTYTVYAAR